MELGKSAPYIGHDKNSIDRALRAIAHKWVPGIFPNGRINVESNGKRALRVANIVSGRAPRKRGSCRIWLEGPNAGDWVDFDDKDRLKGGPCSTIKEHFELDDHQSFGKALELIEEFGGNSSLNSETPLPNGHASGSVDIDQDLRQRIADAEFDFNEAGPLPGTLGETYWHARKLGPLPAAAFGSIEGEGKPDIRFLEHCRREGRSQPAILARWRTPDGLPTGGVHKTFLRRGGSAHDGKEMRAPHGAGVIMLAPPNAAGELGIGEGQETTAAGMVYFPGVGGWAAGDAGGMVKLARWLGEREAGRASGAATGPGSPADQTARIKRLLIWADRGKAGEGAAGTLAAAARAAGIAAVEVYAPRGDDDLAADLLAGEPAPVPLTDAEIAELSAAQATLPLAAGDAPEGAGPPIAEQPGLGVAPSPAAPAGGPGAAGPPAWASEPVVAAAVPAGPLPGLSEISTRLMTLEKGVIGDVVLEILRQIAGAQLDPINEETMINLMYRKTGIKKRTIEETLRQLKGQIISPSHGEQSKPWLAKLAINNDGSPIGIMSNVAIVLRDADEWQGVFWFDEFTQEIWLKRRPPYESNSGFPCERKWTDDDELSTTEWIQKVAGIHAQRHIVFEGVHLVALENKYHQVRDYLKGLEWDGVPRLDNFPITYLGYNPKGPNGETEEETKARYKLNKYVWAAVKKWMIGAVARAFHPGIKNDTMPILVGHQGYRKSTAIKRLAGEEWYTDDMPEFGTKDAAIQLRGVWIAELSELDSMRGAELSKVKAFASRGTDRYRPPYGRVPIDVPRECVFIGTVNEKEFLRDITGGRRYWPIPIHNRIDPDPIERDRDQLWAEAVDLYLKGEKWYFDDDTEKEIIEAAEVEQEARRQQDSWENRIDWYLNTDKPLKAYVSTEDVLKEALHIDDRSKWGKAEEMRVGRILQKMGWVRKQKRLDGIGDPKWRYFRP